MFMLILWLLALMYAPNAPPIPAGPVISGKPIDPHTPTPGTARNWSVYGLMLGRVENGKAPRQCATGSNLPDPCGCTRTAADHRDCG